MFLILSILILILGRSDFVFGQADYRNLDPGRPIVIEDAQPIEFRAFEFQLGLPRYTRTRGDVSLLAFAPGLTWGFAKDWEAGLEGENITQLDGTTKNGFGDTQLHLLYNLNQEGELLPAVAFRPEWTVGTGPFGGDYSYAGLKGIVSKTLGMNRIHLNGSYTAGPPEAPGRAGDRISRALYGIAYERTFPILFAVFLVDLYAVRPIERGRTELIADLGGRVQLTPTSVLDAGLVRALRNEGEVRYGFTLGVTTLFSFRRLFPTGADGGGGAE